MSAPAMVSPQTLVSIDPNQFSLAVVVANSAREEVGPIISLIKNTLIFRIKKQAEHKLTKPSLNDQDKPLCGICLLM